MSGLEQPRDNSTDISGGLPFQGGLRLPAVSSEEAKKAILQDLSVSAIEEANRIRRMGLEQESFRPEFLQEDAGDFYVEGAEAAYAEEEYIQYGKVVKETIDGLAPRLSLLTGPAVQEVLCSLLREAFSMWDSLEPCKGAYICALEERFGFTPALRRELAPDADRAFLRTADCSRTWHAYSLWPFLSDELVASDRFKADCREYIFNLIGDEEFLDYTIVLKYPMMRGIAEEMKTDQEFRDALADRILRRIEDDTPRYSEAAVCGPAAHIAREFGLRDVFPGKEAFEAVENRLAFKLGTRDLSGIADLIALIPRDTQCLSRFSPDGLRMVETLRETASECVLDLVSKGECRQVANIRVVTDGILDPKFTRSRAFLGAVREGTLVLLENYEEGLLYANEMLRLIPWRDGLDVRNDPAVQESAGSALEEVVREATEQLSCWHKLLKASVLSSSGDQNTQMKRVAGEIYQLYAAYWGIRSDFMSSSCPDFPNISNLPRREQYLPHFNPVYKSIKDLTTLNSPPGMAEKVPLISPFSWTRTLALCDALINRKDSAGAPLLQDLRETISEVPFTKEDSEHYGWRLVRLEAFLHDTPSKIEKGLKEAAKYAFGKISPVSPEACQTWLDLSDFCEIQGKTTAANEYYALAQAIMNYETVRDSFRYITDQTMKSPEGSFLREKLEAVTRAYIRETPLNVLPFSVQGIKNIMRNFPVRILLK